MLPGGQHIIVILTKPQIRNLYTVDKQDEYWKVPKLAALVTTKRASSSERAEAEFDLATLA